MENLLQKAKVVAFSLGVVALGFSVGNVVQPERAEAQDATFKTDHYYCQDFNGSCAYSYNYACNATADDCSGYEM